MIYTTNAIESLNSVIRKATKNRKLFPDDAVATKVNYLDIEAAGMKWSMPIRYWKAALNRFMIEFPAPYAGDSVNRAVTQNYFQTRIDNNL